MTRSQEIENIIIGTLLNSFDTDDWFMDCAICITVDMFEDSRNAKIYSTIAAMHKVGLNMTTPIDVFEFGNEETKSFVDYMVELASNYHYLVKKCYYNESVWIERMINGKRYRYTEVKFSDYVSKFVQNAIEKEKARNKTV